MSLRCTAAATVTVTAAAAAATLVRCPPHRVRVRTHHVRTDRTRAQAYAA